MHWSKLPHNERDRVNSFRNYFDIGFSAAFKDLISTINALLDFFFSFSPPWGTQQVLTSFMHQYSQSGRKLRGTQPNTPWAADWWSDSGAAASPSSRSPLRRPQEPARWHQAGQRRLLCSALRVFLCRGCGWRQTLYGMAEACLQPGKQSGGIGRTFWCQNQKSKHPSAGLTLLHTTWAELGLIAPLMWQVLEGLTSPLASIK